MRETSPLIYIWTLGGDGAWRVRVGGLEAANITRDHDRGGWTVRVYYWKTNAPDLAAAKTLAERRLRQAGVGS